MDEADYTRLRQRMVEFQLKARGIHSPNVLEAKIRWDIIPPFYMSRKRIIAGWNFTCISK